MLGKILPGAWDQEIVLLVSFQNSENLQKIEFHVLMLEVRL